MGPPRAHRRQRRRAWASARAAPAKRSSKPTAESSASESRDLKSRNREDPGAQDAGWSPQRNREHFTVCIVGYTNAGKSTLFNTLTAAGTYADDKLFATLDTKTRAWKLERGTEVLLSDTVGFVRDLPHNLVASFKATLEEAVHADLLLHVLDVGHPARPAAVRFASTRCSRRSASTRTSPRSCCSTRSTPTKARRPTRSGGRCIPDAIPISAKTGSGLDELQEAVYRPSAGSRWT